ncbi:MAG: alcohol dehydrogenase catalytic domain-containing protein [Oscillibacter sp.]|nr:alcohol dehydrogenase catalytic domain-containing protein [Oscillibacter sp.]
MKGFIYNGPGNITMQEIPLPPCGDNDIIVKNLAAGICGSDINAYQHDGDSVYIFKGFEFGHEMVSEVVEVGKNVEGIQVGDRVYPYPIFAKDDRKRPATVGGFSEYVHIPNCRLNWSVFKVDDTISNKAAAMIEPFTVGGHSAKICQPGPGKKAMVFGGGIIGMSAAITLHYMGCEKVMVVNRSTYRLDKAAALGFATCSPVKEDLKAKAIEYFGKSFGIAGEVPDIDIFIDATGAADALDNFVSLGKRGSMLSIVGVHHAPRTIDLMKVTYGDLTIKGSPGYDFEDVARAMEIMKSGKYDIESLVSHTFPLEQLEEAIQTAAVSGASEKVLIEY